jgi:hypothetical protein
VALAIDPGRLLRAALPVTALVSIIVVPGATLAVAGETLGYDFLAYHLAAVRVLEGGPLYDLTFQSTGGFGLFYYPPPFVLVALPFGLLPPDVATWVWIGLLGAAFAAGVAILPVERSIKWAIVLLAGLQWPFVYALKLGQVGPLLFLAFAIGWRWLGRDGAVGVSGAVGAALKIQPGLVLAWAFALRRWRAVAWGAGVLVVVSGLSVVVAGFAAWTDYLELLRRVSDPITTEHNFTPGAIAFQLGASPDLAVAIQVGTSVAVVAIVLAGLRWATPEASYLSVVAASQLLSPVLWDHYAMLVLLPVAYLLARRWWWAAALPLVTAVPLVSVTPAATYPVVFAVALVAPLVAGWKGAGAAGSGAAGSGAAGASSGAAGASA